MKEDINSLIKWVDTGIQTYEKLIKDPLESKYESIYKDSRKKMLFIKEYLNDYEKLAKDYQELSRKNSILRLQKMELESHTIEEAKFLKTFNFRRESDVTKAFFEEMKMAYRANRRKWKSKL